MREVNFHEVGMENYGPYTDPMILKFVNDQLVLITGPNGIGKTMALDALPFTLYGSTNKGQRGDDVVNNVVGKNCHTWVYFSSDGVKYEVNRYHKYTRLHNTVTLKREGEEKPYKKGQKEVLPEIERLLCPKKLFMNTIMFGQKVKDFFTDLMDSDKKEIFRKILSLDIYTLYYNLAKDNLDELKKLLDKRKTEIEIKNGLIKDADEQIELLKLQKKAFESEAQQNIDNLKKDIQDCERMIETWQDKLSEIKLKDGDIESLQDQVNKLDRKIVHLRNTKDSKLQDLKNQKLLKIQELNQSASEGKHKLVQDYGDQSHTIQSQYTKNKTTVGIMLNQSEEFQNALSLDDAICPTCFQDIDETCLENLQSQADEIETKISEIESQNSTLGENLSDLEKEKNIEIAKIDNRLRELLSKLEDMATQESEEIIKKYDQEKKEIFDKGSDILVELEALQKVKGEIKEAEEGIANLGVDMTYKKKEIKKLENLEYDMTQMNSYFKKAGDLHNELQVLIRDVITFEDLIKIVEFWKAAYSPSGIPSMLIDEAIPFMNSQVSYYLDKLTNGRYVVSFDTLAQTKGGEFRDKISVNVLDTHTRANSRIQLSGGQTRIIDIATILTLGDLQSNIQSTQFNLLIFDEIFDSLDEENIGFVSKVLTQIKPGKSIYLISHRHEDQLEADEVLELK